MASTTATPPPTIAEDAVASGVADYTATPCTSMTTSTP